MAENTNNIIGSQDFAEILQENGISLSDDTISRIYIDYTNIIENDVGDKEDAFKNILTLNVLEDSILIARTENAEELEETDPISFFEDYDELISENSSLAETEIAVSNTLDEVEAFINDGYGVIESAHETEAVIDETADGKYSIFINNDDGEETRNEYNSKAEAINGLMEKLDGIIDAKNIAYEHDDNFDEKIDAVVSELSLRDDSNDSATQENKNKEDDNMAKTQSDIDGYYDEDAESAFEGTMEEVDIDGLGEYPCLETDEDGNPQLYLIGKNDDGDWEVRTVTLDSHGNEIESTSETFENRTEAENDLRDKIEADINNYENDMDRGMEAEYDPVDSEEADEDGIEAVVADDKENDENGDNIVGVHIELDDGNSVDTYMTEKEYNEALDNKHITEIEITDKNPDPVYADAEKNAEMEIPEGNVDDDDEEDMENDDDWGWDSDPID